MLAVIARKGLLAGKFRHGDITVLDDRWTSLDPKEPAHREFLLKFSRVFVVVREGQEKTLAEAGLELLDDGRVVESKKKK